MRAPVSVCIASYNGEKYIKEQLLSILPQLGPADEIVISDDGSKDNTRKAAEELADSRIRFVDGPKKGFACNFFNAVSCASNEIVFLCDQDDIWASDKVEKVMRVFEEDPECTTVIHEMYTFHDSIDEKGNEFPRKYKKGFVHNVLFSGYWGCCMAFKKSLLEGYLPVTQTRLAHDQLIGLLSERAGKTCLIPEKLLYHRMHGGNKTASIGTKEKIAFRAQIFKEYEEMEDACFSGGRPGKPAKGAGWHLLNLLLGKGNK